MSCALSLLSAAEGEGRRWDFSMSGLAVVERCRCLGRDLFVQAELIRLDIVPVFRVVLDDGSPWVHADALDTVERFETAVLEEDVLQQVEVKGSGDKAGLPKGNYCSIEEYP